MKVSSDKLNLQNKRITSDYKQNFIIIWPKTSIKQYNNYDT